MNIKPARSATLLGTIAAAALVALAIPAMAQPQPLNDQNDKTIVNDQGSLDANGDRDSDNLRAEDQAGADVDLDNDQDGGVSANERAENGNGIGADDSELDQDRAEGRANERAQDSDQSDADDSSLNNPDGGSNL